MHKISGFASASVQVDRIAIDNIKRVYPVHHKDYFPVSVNLILQQRRKLNLTNCKESYAQWKCKRRKGFIHHRNLAGRNHVARAQMRNLPYTLPCGALYGECAVANTAFIENLPWNEAWTYRSRFYFVWALRFPLKQTNPCTPRVQSVCNVG